MLKPKDISNYNSLSKEQKQVFERKIQETDLNYLSSIAFEQFNVSNSDIDDINQLIDKKSNHDYRSFNTIFISLLCGLLIGISTFFIFFRKSENHPSVFQSLEEERIQKKLNNVVTATDTTFPIHETKQIEHYNTIVNNLEETKTVETPDVMESKPATFSVPENENNDDIIFQFTPNAPIVFINNLKVTNYRLYYFKQSQAINLDVNSGVPAQYGSKADIERIATSRSNSYFAHKIIQQAMRLFNSKNIANCIEELTLLYNFNHDDANAQFYLGMCYFQLGKYNIASNYFQENLDNTNNIFHQESEYYEALCLLNIKQIDKAVNQLQSIVNNKGFYSSRAQEILDKQSK